MLLSRRCLLPRSSKAHPTLLLAVVAHQRSDLVPVTWYIPEVGVIFTLWCVWWSGVDGLRATGGVTWGPALVGTRDYRN